MGWLILVPPVAPCLRCLNPPESFCYICGCFIVSSQRLNVSDIVKRSNLTYLTIKVGGQNKSWARTIYANPMSKIYASGKRAQKKTTTHIWQSNDMATAKDPCKRLLHLSYKHNKRTWQNKLPISAFSNSFSASFRWKTRFHPGENEFFTIFSQWKPVSTWYSFQGSTFTARWKWH